MSLRLLSQSEIDSYTLIWRRTNGQNDQLLCESELFQLCVKFKPKLAEVKKTFVGP